MAPAHGRLGSVTTTVPVAEVVRRAHASLPPDFYTRWFMQKPA
jgi:hypothetical protein